jgi:hypothetical protein
MAVERYAGAVVLFVWSYLNCEMMVSTNQDSVWALGKASTLSRVEFGFYSLWAALSVHEGDYKPSNACGVVLTQNKPPL